MGTDIVCGIDASPSSRGPAALAGWLAGRLDSRVVLTHVEAPSRSSESNGIVSISRARELGRLRGLAEEHGVPDRTLTRLVTGDAARQLVLMAEEHDAQLLVVGSSGHRELGCGLLGAVSSALMRAAPCPVVVAPPGGSVPPAAVGPMICGVEGSDSDGELLRLGADLSSRLGGTLHAVHAFDRRPVYAGAAYVPPVLPELDDSARATVRRAKARASVDAREWVVDASPAAALRQVAERTGAGMVVVASKGRGRLGSILHGSVAIQLAADASCPVVVLPPSAKLAPGTGHYELSRAA